MSSNGHITHITHITHTSHTHIIHTHHTHTRIRYKEWLPGWDDDVRRDKKNGPGPSSGDDLRHADGAPVYKDHYTKLLLLRRR